MSSSYDDYNRYADLMAKPFDGFSSVGENFAAGVGEMFDEYSSFSSFINRINYDERNKQLQQLLDSGQIPDLMTAQHERQGRRTNTRRQGGKDWNTLAEWANDNLKLPDHIATDKELQEERNHEMAFKRKYREDIFNRATGWGKASALAGNFVAGGLDPVVIAASVISAPLVGSVAASRGLYALSVAGRSALGGAASQAAIEPFVWSWQEETGGEYTWKDATFNIAAAGVFSGGLSGTAALFGHKGALTRQVVLEDRKNKKQALAIFKENTQQSLDKKLAVIDSQLEKVQQGSREFKDLVNARYEIVTKHKELIRRADMGTEEFDAVLNMYEEISILSQAGLKMSLKDAYENIEKTVDSYNQGRTINPDPIPIENTPRPRPKKTVSEPEPETTKPKEGETGEVETPEQLIAERDKLREELYEMTRTMDEEIVTLRQEVIINDLNKKIKNLEKRKENASEDVIDEIDDQIAELQDEAEIPYDLRDITEEQAEMLDKRVGHGYNQRVTAINTRLQKLNKQIGDTEGSPLDQAVANIDDDVVYIDTDGNEHHISDVVKYAETEQDILDETITCMMRNNLG